MGSDYKKNQLLLVYKQNRHLSAEQLYKSIPCSLSFAQKTIREFNKPTANYTEDTVKLVKNSEDLHLEKSVGFKNKGLHYLFTKVAEKELKTEGFKILNEDDFSNVELDWLRVNYKFTPLSKYL